jgi:hypothetical protein
MCVMLGLLMTAVYKRAHHEKLSECALYLKWRDTNDVFHAPEYCCKGEIEAKLDCARQSRELAD